jgi:hypothetical protein
MPMIGQASVNFDQPISCCRIEWGHRRRRDDSSEKIRLRVINDSAWAQQHRTAAHWPLRLYTITHHFLSRRRSSRMLAVVSLNNCLIRTICGLAGFGGTNEGHICTGEG